MRTVVFAGEDGNGCAEVIFPFKIREPVFVSERRDDDFFCLRLENGVFEVCRVSHLTSCLAGCGLCDFARRVYYFCYLMVRSVSALASGKLRRLRLQNIQSPLLHFRKQQLF